MRALQSLKWETPDPLLRHPSSSMHTSGVFTLSKPDFVGRKSETQGFSTGEPTLHPLCGSFGPGSYDRDHLLAFHCTYCMLVYVKVMIGSQAMEGRPGNMCFPPTRSLLRLSLSRCRLPRLLLFPTQPSCACMVISFNAVQRAPPRSEIGKVSDSPSYE